MWGERSPECLFKASGRQHRPRVPALESLTHFWSPLGREDSVLSYETVTQMEGEPGPWLGPRPSCSLAVFSA